GSWDMLGKPLDVIDVSVMEELEAVVEKISTDAAIKGAVVTSGKDTFGGGADLTMLEKQRNDYEAAFKQKGEDAAIAMVFERSRRLSQIYRKLKTSPKSKQPWDVDGFKLPGGPVWSKMGMMTWPAANALYRKETQDNYPAARAIMSSVFEGLQVPFDTALRIESRYFAKIVRSPEAAAMIRSLFVSMQELTKGARRPANQPQTALQKIG